MIQRRLLVNMSVTAAACLAALAMQFVLVWLLWRTGESFICSAYQPFRRVDRILSVYIALLATLSAAAMVSYPFLCRSIWRRLAGRNADREHVLAAVPRKWPRILFVTVVSLLATNAFLTPFFVGIPKHARERILAMFDEAGIGDTTGVVQIEPPIPYAGNPYAGEGFSVPLPPGKVVVARLGDAPSMNELRVLSGKSTLPNFAQLDAASAEEFSIIVRFFNIRSTAAFLDTVFSIVPADVESVKTRLGAAAMAHCIVFRSLMEDHVSSVRSFEAGPTVKVFVSECPRTGRNINRFEIIRCEAQSGATLWVNLFGTGLDMDSACRMAAGTEVAGQ